MASRSNRRLDCTRLRQTIDVELQEKSKSGIQLPRFQWARGHQIRDRRDRVHPWASSRERVFLIDAIVKVLMQECQLPTIGSFDEPLHGHPENHQGNLRMAALFRQPGSEATSLIQPGGAW